MFFIVQSNNSFNFLLGLIKYIVIVTLLDEPLVLVLFILKLCNVWQYFSASAFNFVSYKPGTWTVYYKYKYPDTEIVCNTFLTMTDPINHLKKVSGRWFFSLLTLSQREGERREVRKRGRFVQFAISSPWHYYRLVKMSIGRFSEAGLRFVIFRARSCRRSQHTSGPISE